ncbi:unnamed protein product [Urochloa decumbens]|uniref:Uncharacterized protein n=1 Tax=Urochloa decumbens TaxID=240449 RepID=A0ABC8Z259_9POAL
MARSVDSDYIDFSHMGGFDMGIYFDGFGENVMKFVELPVKYLDSAHDKAVEFIEDFQAMLFAPFTDDEVPNEEDQSSSNVITESSPTSVETELVEPNTEASTPAPLVSVENSSTGCVDAEAHGTESFSSESTDLSSMNHVYPKNTSSEEGLIEANDLLCLLPEAEAASPSGICDNSEEIILWNPEASIKPRLRGLTAIPQDDHAPHALETDQVPERVGLHCSEHPDSSVCSREIPLENCSANYEEEVVLDGANDAAGVTVQDSANLTQDDYVPHTLHTDQPPGLHCSVHSDILVDSAVFFQALLLEDSSANYEEKMVSYGANGPVEATQDDYVPQALNEDFHCSEHSDILVDSATFFEALLLEDSTAHSEEQMVSYSANTPVEATTDGSSAGTSISHESSSDVPSCTDDPNMPTYTIAKSVVIENIRDFEEHMENEKIEVSPVPQRNNATFQEMLVRNLSSKLWWSKKQVSMHQAMPAGSQDAENIGYKLVSSTDDIEHDWEVL